MTLHVPRALFLSSWRTRECLPKFSAHIQIYKHPGHAYMQATVQFKLLIQALSAFIFNITQHTGFGEKVHFSTLLKSVCMENIYLLF